MTSRRRRLMSMGHQAKAEHLGGFRGQHVVLDVRNEIGDDESFGGWVLSITEEYGRHRRYGGVSWVLVFQTNGGRTLAFHMSTLRDIRSTRGDQ